RARRATVHRVGRGEFRDRFPITSDRSSPSTTRGPDSGGRCDIRRESRLGVVVSRGPANIVGQAARILCLAAPLAACAPSGSDPVEAFRVESSTIEPVVLLDQQYSDFTSVERLVITDSVPWREALDRIPGAPSEAAAVDFGRSMVLLVAAGERNRAGSPSMCPPFTATRTGSRSPYRRSFPARAVP